MDTKRTRQQQRHCRHTQARSVAGSAAAMGNATRKFGLILRKDLPVPELSTSLQFVDACRTVAIVATSDTCMSLERKRIGLLGCGGFGAVELVEHAALGDTYALKAFRRIAPHGCSPRHMHVLRHPHYARRLSVKAMS